MKDVKFCLAFMHDPGSFHAKAKKIMVPGDIKGMKIRPAHATMASFVTLLGGTNVQSSAPEVRDILEKGVAEAVTFPWGSVPLFGIDKVTKYHMDVPLYATTFAFVFNKGVYNQMSAAQKKVIDDHCTNEWSLKVAGPWADFEAAGVQKLKSDPAHEVYPISAEQVRDELSKAIKAAAPSYGVFNAALLNPYSEEHADDPAWKEAVAPLSHIPQASQRAVPQFLTRGTQDRLIADAAVKEFVDALVKAGQRAEYVQVGGANHAFFDWKPDASTKATFAKYGVYYAAAMKAFFKSVLY